MPLGPEDITLTGKTLTGGVVSAATLSNCISTGGTISGSTLATCNLTGSTLAGNVAAGTTITAPKLLGTSTLPHVQLTSKALLGTAVAGGVEYDGVALYGTVQSSARGVIPTEQMIFNTSAYTGTTAGTAQKMFDASTGLNGAVTVGPSVSYMFQTAFTITGRSTLTHTIAYGFGGTAAIDRITFIAFQCTQAVSSTPGTPTLVRCTVNNHAICATNTSSVCTAFIQGRLTIGTSGTIIPQITRSASVVALTVAPDSYFRLWPIGSTALNRVGHWS
jgi:hypothetical protein